MIPTRLNQQFNSGTVTGFNRKTGSVIVFSNTVTNKVHSLGPYDHINTEYSTLKMYPAGYQWPKLSDFDHLTINHEVSYFGDPISLNAEHFLQQVIPQMLDPKVRVPYCLLTATYNGVNEYDEPEIFTDIVLRQDYFNRWVIQKFSHSSGRHYGNLLPVITINGSNADLLDKGENYDTN